MNIISIIICIIISLLCYWVGSDISIKSQLPIYESLRNTSAIIFGVMGAWIAILYPKALLKIYGKLETKEAEEQTKSIKQLISPMVLSTIIVSFVLVVSLLAPVLRNIAYLQQYTHLVRSLSFAILGGLTFLQLWALVATLAPSDLINKRADFSIRKRKKIKDVFPDIE
ncbi:MAG: hypothetical protein PHZ02_14225 [Desulfocapsaceae bacterium]|nr:hypothetical protein [Desulfocapsaceae bacterium]